MQKEIPERLHKWVRTNDDRGLKVNFKVMCHHCNEEMFLRNSELLHQRKNAFGRAQVTPIMKIMYKCIPCAQVYWFYVGHPFVDNDYWNEVMKWRDNHPLWIPPLSEWSDDAKVQQRLKDLGYLGGDVEEEVTELEE